MARMNVDVDLCDFRAQDVADYVASNDRIWEMATKEREAVLYRRCRGPVWEAEAAWMAAMRDGLIKGTPPPTPKPDTNRSDER